MRRTLVGVTVLAAVTVAACDNASGPDIVVEGTPPATPYRGPLYVPTTFLDEDTPQAVATASGAAGRALECDGEIYDGGGPDGWSKRDGGNSPEEGLKLYFDMFQPQFPTAGYRVERRESDRVLYSFDVGGRTKVAVVVAKDQKTRPGWGPETNASCDPAELPSSFTDSLEYEIWTDKDGKRAPVTEINSYAGADHCDWHKAHFLNLGRGEDARSYARDPDGVLDADVMLTAPYDGDVRAMPADVHDTGYRHHDWQLWLTPDGSTAYVRTPDGFEAWPLVNKGVGCM
ncbi:hypothetical protein H1V43_37715 [Streptomyces sp. PSKA54]|uniref:Lipoprotein n=1 Tax=Streptomyces himalayensis subsp. aureolus TaxID=2758039 RepID=A0A7W2D974_9ACTN|nr:hypothetical protein [Streptomyces himalayensis]MBA4866936.1 hypothetical protein [Streptomyces himalayensis subsp. aureolus]